MATKQEIITALHALKPELQARFKVKEIGLFGSYVRGEQKESSDVDLLVTFDKDASLFNHMRLELYLEEKLRQKVDVVSRNALRKEIREEVLNQVVFA